MGKTLRQVRLSVVSSDIPPSFGTDKPSLTGTLFRASQFLAEELPIRLAHRVQELQELPDGLGDMPSITRVRDWYAQSFEELTTMQRPSVTNEVRERLMKPAKNPRSKFVDEATQNPSIESNGNGNQNKAMGGARRYFANTDDGKDWPPELADYNKKFRNVLDKIKRRHDGVVTTVGKSHKPRVAGSHLVHAFD